MGENFLDRLIWKNLCIFALSCINYENKFKATMYETSQGCKKTYMQIREVFWFQNNGEKRNSCCRGGHYESDDGEENVGSYRTLTYESYDVNGWHHKNCPEQHQAVRNRLLQIGSTSAFYLSSIQKDAPPAFLTHNSKPPSCRSQWVGDSLDCWKSDSALQQQPLWQGCQMVSASDGYLRSKLMGIWVPSMETFQSIYHRTNCRGIAFPTWAGIVKVQTRLAPQPSYYRHQLPTGKQLKQWHISGKLLAPQFSPYRTR